MKRTIQLIIALILLLAPALNHAQTIVYVAQGATGNGTSWSNALGNLKTALNNATAGTRIWVKQGTYRPVTCSNCTFNDRNARFQIPNGVKVYGGFAGTETSIDQRNIAAHPTYLSGDINQDGTLANNSFTIVYTHNVNNETVADGFIITGGNADYSTATLGASQNSGAGWYNEGSLAGNNSHPVIANCQFINNYAWGYGGGMVNEGSFSGNCHTALTKCKFTGNIARNGGGAIYNTGSFGGKSNPVLTDCIFENNESELSDGGAMFNIGSENGECNPDMSGCTFSSNSAFGEGGAVYNFGKTGNCSPAMHNCLVENNEASLGGAIYNDGTFNGLSGGVYTDCHFIGNHSTSDGGVMYSSGFKGICNPEIINCLFENNHSASSGGAIFNNGIEGICKPEIKNCRFLNNVADTYGGAMYNQGKTGNASPSLTNCIFYNNSALSAGAIYNLGADSGKANAVMTNCTFYGNQANVGGAIYCNAGEGGTGEASPAVRNCIFWNNTAGEGKVFRIIWGTPTISYSLVDVADCQALYNGMGGAVNCGNGLIFNQNPQFVSPATVNFHLATGSPAIDDGSNDAVNQANILIDLDSLPRIFNNTVDMGVYEFGSTVGSAPVITQSPQSQVVCAGDPVSFSVSATGSQPLIYQWLKNGNPVSGEVQNVFTILDAQPANAGTYTCSVTNATQEVVVSQPAILTVNTPAAVSLAISASQTEICEGEEVMFTAEAANGGSTPVFQWLVNGIPFGSNAQSVTYSDFENEDIITCIVTTSLTCVSNMSAMSNAVEILVENVQVASLSIAADEEVICEGQAVTFTASPVKGGNSPSYKWLLNGNEVGTSTPAFSASTLQSGDQIQCEMTSSKNCLAMNPVVSNTIAITITPNETASVVISPSIDSTFCLGTEIVFTATVENAGNAPVYEWLINGLPTGTNAPVFSTTALQDQYQVACNFTSSRPCILENPVLSNIFVAQVDSCTVAVYEDKMTRQAVQVYPNPANGKFFVEIINLSGKFALRLSNTHGQELLNIFEEHPYIPFIRELDLTAFPKGIYYLQIVSGEIVLVEKLVLN